MVPVPQESAARHAALAVHGHTRAYESDTQARFDRNSPTAHVSLTVTLALLIRHGDTDAVGQRLVGRLPGIRLNARGRKDASELARLARLIPLDAIYCSPLERTRETAIDLARECRTTAEVDAAIIEVDFGEWTGLTFEELNTRSDWQAFNAARSTAQVPGGESAPQLQRRIVAALDRLATRHRGGAFAIVSHADVIRAAVLHFTRRPLDDVHRVTIEPASITGVDMDPPQRVLYVNRRVDELRSAIP